MPPPAGTAQLFQDGAAAYRSYRPTYPAELYDAVLQFAALPRMQLAIDIGCGNGQATLELARRFERVVGLDGAPEQLAHAAAAPNVSYAAGDAHATGLPGGCADLVTVAQALHWFDLPRFYAEAARLLAPHGTLAAWTYALPVLGSASHPANAVLRGLYSDVLGPYWAPQRRLVEAEYAGLEPGPQHFAHVTRLKLSSGSPRSVDQIVGYVSSWSAYSTYRRQHPDAPDPLVAFRVELEAALRKAAAEEGSARPGGGSGSGDGDGGGDGDALKEVTFHVPIVLLLARQPVKGAADGPPGGTDTP